MNPTLTQRILSIAAESLELAKGADSSADSMNRETEDTARLVHESRQASLAALKNDIFRAGDMKTEWLEEHRNDAEWTAFSRKCLVDELNRRYAAGEPGPCGRARNDVRAALALATAIVWCFWGTPGCWAQAQAVSVDPAGVRQEVHIATKNPDGDVRQGRRPGQVERGRRRDLWLTPLGSRS